MMNNCMTQAFFIFIFSMLFSPFIDAQTLDAGGLHICALQNDDTAVCWGKQTQTVPEKETFTQVSAGAYHSCGVRTTDETIECWTSSARDFGQVTPPKGTFLQVSAGYYHSCALRTDHTAICWQGQTTNDYGQAQPPEAETFIQVSVGRWHSCGIRTDGTVACWGSNTNPYAHWDQSIPEQDHNDQQATPPEGTFIQINAAMAGWHTCGVRSDNTVTCWGSNDHGQATPPEGHFLQVSGGKWHTCGLRTDNTITCWGSDSDGQSTPPKGHFTHITAGVFETCGIRTNSTVICWGADAEGRIRHSTDYLVKSPNATTNCFIYGVYENSSKTTQLFTIEPGTFELNPFDAPYRDNLTALDIHPLTYQLYAASSPLKNGHLYQAGLQRTPMLTDRGEFGFRGDIVALSFHPDGTLWGWSPKNGLFQMPNTSDNEPQINKVKIMISDSGEIEIADLTWDIAGTILYGIENVYNEDKSEFQRARLWAYHYEAQSIQLVCEQFMDALAAEVVALDTLPDDTLLLGLGEEQGLNLTVLEVPSCEQVIQERIVTELEGISSLAWPECSSY